MTLTAVPKERPVDGQKPSMSAERTLERPSRDTPGIRLSETGLLSVSKQSQARLVNLVLQKDLDEEKQHQVYRTLSPLIENRLMDPEQLKRIAVKGDTPLASRLKVLIADYIPLWPNRAGDVEAADAALIGDKDTAVRLTRLESGYRDSDAKQMLSLESKTLSGRYNGVLWELIARSTENPDTMRRIIDKQRSELISQMLDYNESLNMNKNKSLKESVVKYASIKLGGLLRIRRGK